MTRRFYKTLVFGLAVAAVVAVLWWRPWRGGSGRPMNLVLITLDTCRADHLGCYGEGAAAPTPNLDSLARRGVLFTRAITVSPLTLPAHASILTGTYPTFHKVRNNMDFQLPRDVPTLAETLRKQGYATGAVISGIPLESAFGLNRGFDFYDDNFTQVNVDLSHEREAGVVPLKNEKRAEEATASALAWLRAQAGKRFFLWVHYFDPHTEYKPPRPFAQQFKDRPYAGEIAYMDYCLGNLLKHLRDTRLDDSTVIVAVGDHGEGLSEHGEPTHGVFLYDSVMRVPLIFCAPSLPGSAGIRCDERVSVVDIAPTVLRLLNLPCELPAQGRSLLELLAGRATREEALYYAENLATFLTMGWSPLRALYTDRWKYIHAPTPELYDLNHDPREMKNVAKEHADIVKQMADRLAAMAAETGHTQAAQTALDLRTQESIRSLGYVGGIQRFQAGDTLNVSGLKDPKDMLPVLASINQGLAQTNLGRWDEALRSFRQALSSDPTNLMVWRMVEDVCLRKKDLVGAREASERVASLAPDAPSAQYKRGCLLVETGDLESGLKAFARALELDPKFALGHVGIAAVRLKQGRYAEARQEYEAALALDPRLTVAAIGVAASLERSGAATAAVDFLQAQIQKQPKNYYLHLTLGQTYRGAGRLPEAIEALKTATLLEPNTADAYLELAGAYMDMGNFREALSVLRQAERIAPLSAAVRHKMGKYYLLTEQYEQAEEEFRRALAADPKLAAARNDLGAALQLRGFHDLALIEYQKAVALDPQCADAWQNMGLLRFGQGRYAEAAQCLRRAVPLKPNDPNAAFQLAVACLNAGQREEAEKAAKHALELNPLHAQAKALLKQLCGGPQR